MKLFMFMLVIAMLSITSCQEGSMNQAGSFTDSRDGNEYATVNICGQVWMAENLRYETLNSTTYNNNPNYGRYYMWSEISSVCPNGWHLPSDIEWTNMEICTGMNVADSSIIGVRGSHGNNLKSESGWYPTLTGDNTNGNNLSGLNVFPAGRIPSIGSSIPAGVESIAYFYTSTLGAQNRPLIREFYSNADHVQREQALNTNIMSTCRCVKD